jgi:hypothetical protein
MHTLKATKMKKQKRVETIIDMDIYKKFKKKIEEQGFSMSKWIRHQITKYAK